MYKKNLLNKFFLLFIIFNINLAYVFAIPEYPMIISGNVYINEKISSSGAKITAKYNGNEVSSSLTDKDGKFNLLLQKLEKNAAVKFYVDNIDAKAEATYESGSYKELELRVKKPIINYYVLGGGALIVSALVLLWMLKKKSSGSRRS